MTSWPIQSGLQKNRLSIFMGPSEIELLAGKMKEIYAQNVPIDETLLTHEGGAIRGSHYQITNSKGVFVKPELLRHARKLFAEKIKLAVFCGSNRLLFTHPEVLIYAFFHQMPHLMKFKNYLSSSYELVLSIEQSGSSPVFLITEKEGEDVLSQTQWHLPQPSGFPDAPHDPIQE